MRVRLSVIALVCAALVLPGSVPASADRTIKVKDNIFTPVYIVSLGEAFSWALVGDDRHTITSYPDSAVSFDSSPNATNTCDDANPLTIEDCLEPGSTFGPRSFTTVGLYPYRCKIHGSADERPDSKASATNQPCGMCGLIKVVKDKEPTGSSPTRKPKPSSQTVTSRSPSPSVSASVSASPSATLSSDGEPVAAGGSTGSGSGGRALLAFLLLALLSGGGFWTWRRYFA